MLRCAGTEKQPYFCAWCDSVGFRPNSPEQWDDILMEFKNSSTTLTKSKFNLLVASVEFFFPNFKGKLNWCHAALRGWDISNPTKHTIPMLRAHASLLGIYIASYGYPRLCGGLIFQQRKGLRPGELLGLHHDDIVLPEEQSGGHLRQTLSVGLGIKTGTKAKRPQSVIVLQHVDPDVVEFFRRLKRVSTPNQPLFPFPLETYNRLIKSAEAKLGVCVGWTPHSARAGYASEAKAAGVPFTEIRETGRWVADSSLRIYIDVVSAAAIVTRLKTAGLEPALEWASAHWLCYCTEDRLAPRAWGACPPRVRSG